MYLRWLTHPVRESQDPRVDVLCFHTGPGRVAWIPQVVRSFRDPDTHAVRKKLVWCPGRGIRSCCAADEGDPIPRTLWWVEINERIEQLKSLEFKHPDHEELLEVLPGILKQFGKRVPIPSKAECDFVQAWDDEARTPRTRGERLAEWYQRCWDAASAPTEPEPGTISYGAALDVFGLSEGFTALDLKTAYRKAVFAAHPDRGGTHEQFLRVSAAYDMLRTH